jgi:hypothetical protein
MRKIVYVGFFIIFLSMVFTLLVFENFANFNSACRVEECTDMNIFFTMIFGLFIAGAFVTIDTIVGYIIVKEKPWLPGEAYKTAKPKNKEQRLKGLKDELDNLKKSKDETEKQYYKGKFNTQTFEKMLNKYDQRIIETKSKIKTLKSKSKK